jgi:hypothetical protein
VPSTPTRSVWHLLPGARPYLVGSGLPLSPGAGEWRSGDRPRPTKPAAPSTQRPTAFRSPRLRVTRCRECTRSGGLRNRGTRPR